MNEFELLARLIPSLPTDPSVVLGAGDDCAVLDLGLADACLLFKTDSVVEGIHFTDKASPEQIGHKALARCLSDVAAMAGQPSHAVVTLGLPDRFDPARIDALYAGINRLAAAYQVAVVGGEITRNPERLFVSVALLGRVPKDRAVRRSGARAGDALFVTGRLGGSLAGKHLEFRPRVAEARWLASHFALHAMIDLSDGLAGDLRHLMKASGVGAELMVSAIPISTAARQRAQNLGRPLLGEPRHLSQQNGVKSALLAALTDGEDFELLFALASRDAVPLLDQWKAEFPDLPLTCIGKIIEGSQLLLRDKQGARPLTAHGYVHFAEPGGD